MFIKCKSYGGFIWVKEKDYNMNKQYKYEPIINAITEIATTGAIGCIPNGLGFFKKKYK